MVKLIIAGSRDFDNYSLLEEQMYFFKDENVIVISGTARGADRLGERYAKEHNLPVLRFPADWEGKGKAAGYIRNKEMAENATHLLAFWDGKSKGTQHMINLAFKAGLEVTIVRYK